MTAPVIAQVTTASAGGGSLSITMPTLAAGDVCVVAYYCDFSRTLLAEDFSAAGFSGPDEYASPTGGLLHVWHKRCTDASDSDTSYGITWSGGNRTAGQALRITGAAASGTFFEIAASAATGTSTTPNPPSLSPAGGAKDYLIIALCGVDDEASNITAAPSGYSGLDYDEYASSLGCGIAHAYKALSAGSSEDPGTFTNTSSQEWVAQTIAIYPNLVEHSLTPNSVASAPSVGNPALTQDHQLAPTGVASAPSVGSPDLSQVTDLGTPSGVSVAPSVGQPAITQDHSLTPSNVTVQPDVAVSVTNMIAYSAGAFNTQWTKNNTPTITDGYVAGPTGELASRLQATASGHGVYKFAALAAVVGYPLTISFYVKDNGSASPLFRLGTGSNIYGSGSDRALTFNASTQAFTSVHADITGYGSNALTGEWAGWHRVWFSTTPLVAVTPAAICYGYGGAGFDGLFVGAMVNMGSAALPYVPTTTTFATRTGVVITQDHALSATTITAATVSVANPAITQDHALTPTGVAAVSPSVGAPELVQEHVLEAVGISVQPHVATVTGFDADEPRDLLAERRQQLDQGGLIHLFILDLNPIGVNETYYFTPTIFEDGTQVVFDGQTYTYAPIALANVEWSANGDPPNPKVSFPNARKWAAGMARQHSDLIGASLRRIRVYKEFLDGQPLADPEAMYSDDSFRIEQKLNMNRVMGEFSMRPLRSIENRQIPNMVCLKNVCVLRYRRWDADALEFIYDTSELACPYIGSDQFTILNAATINPEEDVCSHTVQGCAARYGDDPLPGSFKPGMARIRV